MTPRPPFRLTLIEILILLVIAATLVAIAVPRLLSHHAARPGARISSESGRTG
jgi:Tfp pilus assembly protein FimT